MNAPCDRNVEVEGVKFTVHLYHLLDNSCYMFAEDTDYGFVFQSEEMDNYDEVKTQFTNTDNKLTLELSEDGRVLTATFDTYTVELPETVVPKGISIRQIMYAVNECDTVEKLRQAYIQLANDYNKFRGECIDRE
jgi:hypothetical protein